MSSFSASMDRDANRQVIQSNESFKTSKTVTFTGTAGNGAIGTVNLFTVTGDVLVTIFAYCTESLAGANTMEVGVNGNTAGLIAGGSFSADFVDAGMVIWDSAEIGTIFAPSASIIGGGADIIITITAADTTAGTLKYYCLWRPLSDDGNVVPA